MNYITFDIETYNPEENMKTAGRSKIDTNKFKVSTIGAYFSWLDEYIVFWEEDAVEFTNLLRYADLVVGYNHIWFDLPVLQKYAAYNLKELPVFDIMVEVENKIGYKLRLNDLAKQNLEIVKTDSFEKFRTYHLEDKWHELSYYCMHDVKITEDLFKMVLKGTPLKYADMLNQREVLVDKPNLTSSNIKSQSSRGEEKMVVEELF